MAGEPRLEEKYERNGWPSICRPDIKAPEGWSLAMLTGTNWIFNHSLSPDGKTIAYLYNTERLTELYTLPVAGGWPGRMTVGRQATQFWWEETPRWSPDNRWLAFCMAGHVQVLAAQGGVPRKISGFTRRASDPVWMPDSLGMIISVEREDALHLLLTDRQGKWPRELTTGQGDDLGAQPAPDGSQVAYVHRPFDDLNRFEIRLVEVSSGKISRLTGAEAQKCLQPRWSPDGSRLAFLSQQTGFYEAWLMNLDGSATRQLTHAKVDLEGLAWSPDGAWLAATANRGGAFDLVLIDAASGEMSDLQCGRGVHANPCWAPDGSFLTCEYVSPIEPRDIYRLNLIKKRDRSRTIWKAGELIRLTNSRLPALGQVALKYPDPVSFKSFDGMEIQGLLFRPEQPNGAAIVYPHGGPRDQYNYDWDIFAQYLVARGYTILAVNYRGGTGFGVDFEHANDKNWGIGDTQDCLFAGRFLGSQAGIDSQRIAIMGSSFGGYLVISCLVRDPETLFACGICKYGDANLFSSWAQCERMTRLYTEMQLGHPAHNRPVYQAGSPINDLANIRSPVLILHGLQDEVVPALAAEELVEGLRKADRVYEYKTYAGESHGFLSHANLQDQYQRIERFLDWYLMPAV